MTDQELIRALRCTSTPGGPLMDCEKCPYRVVEAVPEHLREQVGSDEWESCDVDKIGVDAADRMTAVLGDLERVTRERDAAVENLRVASIEGDMDCNWCAWKTDRTQCYNCSFANNWQWSGPKEG